MLNGDMYKIRHVHETDLPQVADLDYEAFSPYGTVENAETFALRFKAFPSGFVVLTEGGEIAAYRCSEKWLTEREQPLITCTIILILVAKGDRLEQT
jgi:hypothetical protein